MKIIRNGIYPVTVVLAAALLAGADSTQRVSLGFNNAEGNRWSEHSDLTPDGKFVVFATGSWTLLEDGSDTKWVDVYRRNLQTGAITHVSVDSEGAPNNDDSGFPSISDDGLRIAFAAKGDKMENTYFFNTQQPQNSTGDFIWDVFVRDLSVAPAETRLISFGFESFDSNGVGIGEQRSANGETRLPQISGDGKHIVYASKATNLSANDNDDLWDIYVYNWNADQKQSTNTLVSVNSLGVKSDRDCVMPSISDDGRYVVFQSKATNLVDSNGTIAGANSMLILHDRDADGDGIFDEPGAISTKLISRDDLPVH